MESSVGLFDSNLASEYLLCERGSVESKDIRDEKDKLPDSNDTEAPPQTPTQTSSKPSKRSNRLAVACLFCRKRKIKCDGQISCIHCTKKGIECIYPTIPRARRRSSKQLHQLHQADILDKNIKEEYGSFADYCSDSRTSKSTMVQLKAEPLY